MGHLLGSHGLASRMLPLPLIGVLVTVKCMRIHVLLLHLRRRHMIALLLLLLWSLLGRRRLSLLLMNLLLHWCHLSLRNLMHLLLDRSRLSLLGPS